MTDTQNRWIHFIKCGYITAFFAGPLCESWSRSRKSGGIPDICQGDNGPRLLRLASRPQRLQSLRNRELLQLLLANSILLFVIRACLEMLLQGKFAMLEHPAEPDIEEERYLPEAVCTRTSGVRKTPNVAAGDSLSRTFQCL